LNAPSAALRVAHVLPGRIRVKLGTLKGDPASAYALRDAIGDLPGVVRVEASASTGSVLVVYEGANGGWSDRIEELARALAPFVPGLDERRITQLVAAGPDLGQPRDPSGAVRAALGGVNARIASLTGGTDLAVIVPLGLAAFGAGALVFGGGVILPEWYTLLWFAFGTFVALNGTAPAVDVASAEVPML
jgi:hypothetical protein